MSRLDRSKEIAMKVFMKLKLPNLKDTSITLTTTNKLTAYENKNERRDRI